MAKFLFLFTLLTTFVVFAFGAVSEEDIETEIRDHIGCKVQRGPCGGKGRATKMCRAFDDGKVVGCKRGKRRGFRCRYTKCHTTIHLAETSAQDFELVGEDIETETVDHMGCKIQRGPCGGKGRASRMCRAFDDGKVVGCKRGKRRGFRCRYTDCHSSVHELEVVEEDIETEVVDRKGCKVQRGPCGGKGRATKMCRAFDDGKVVGCKRGNRRGFRCRYTGC